MSGNKFPVDYLPCLDIGAHLNSPSMRWIRTRCLGGFHDGQLNDTAIVVDFNYTTNLAAKVRTFEKPVLADLFWRDVFEVCEGMSIKPVNAVLGRIFVSHHILFGIFIYGLPTRYPSGTRA
jgi:hypothetical protein